MIENYNFPKRKSFGIQLAYIPIDKAKVNYFNEAAKIQAKSNTLLFLDEKTQSNGNLVYAIVRDGVITTIYFAKNYVAQDAAKMQVDGIIKNMDAIRNKTVR